MKPYPQKASSRLRRLTAGVGLISLWSATPPAQAAGPDHETLAREVEQLRQILARQQQEINKLRAERDDDQLAEQQRDLIRELVRETLTDVETRNQLLGDVFTATYNKGFVIQSQDGEYKLKINTRLQFRYTGIDRATPPTH